MRSPRPLACGLLAKMSWTASVCMAISKWVRFVVALEDMGAAVAGSSELTGSVEVQGLRQAVTPADVIEDTEAAVECFPGDRTGRRAAYRWRRRWRG